MLAQGGGYRLQALAALAGNHDRVEALQLQPQVVAVQVQAVRGLLGDLRFHRPLQPGGVTIAGGAGEVLQAGLDGGLGVGLALGAVAFHFAVVALEGQVALAGFVRAADGQQAVGAQGGLGVALQLLFQGLALQAAEGVQQQAGIGKGPGRAVEAGQVVGQVPGVGLVQGGLQGGAVHHAQLRVVAALQVFHQAAAVVDGQRQVEVQALQGLQVAPAEGVQHRFTGRTAEGQGGEQAGAGEAGKLLGQFVLVVLFQLADVEQGGQYPAQVVFVVSFEGVRRQVEARQFAHAGQQPVCSGGSGLIDQASQQRGAVRQLGQRVIDELGVERVEPLLARAVALDEGWQRAQAVCPGVHRALVQGRIQAAGFGQGHGEAPDGLRCLALVDLGEARVVSVFGGAGAVPIAAEQPLGEVQPGTVDGVAGEQLQAFLQVGRDPGAGGVVPVGLGLEAGLQGVVAVFEGLGQHVPHTPFQGLEAIGAGVRRDARVAGDLGQALAGVEVHGLVVAPDAREDQGIHQGGLAVGAGFGEEGVGQGEAVDLFPERVLVAVFGQQGVALGQGIQGAVEEGIEQGDAGLLAGVGLVMLHGESVRHGLNHPPGGPGAGR